MSGAVLGGGMRLAGAREWALEAGARSSRTSTCASAAVGAGVLVGPSVRAVVHRPSVSTSVGGEALVGSAAAAAADGVSVSDYGRASWCASEIGRAHV